MVLEIVTYTLNTGVSEADFLAVHAEFCQFLDAQPGLEYRTLAKDAQGKYLDVVYWASQADLDKVQTTFKDDARCHALLAVVDEASIVFSQCVILSHTPCEQM